MAVAGSALRRSCLRSKRSVCLGDSWVDGREAERTPCSHRLVVLLLCRRETSFRLLLEEHEQVILRLVEKFDMSWEYEPFRQFLQKRDVRFLGEDNDEKRPPSS